MSETDFLHTPISQINPNEKLIAEGEYAFECSSYRYFEDSDRHSLTFTIVDDPEFEGRRIRKNLKNDEKTQRGIRLLADATLGAEVENLPALAAVEAIFNAVPKPRVLMRTFHFTPDDGDTMALIDLLSVKAA